MRYFLLASFFLISTFFPFFSFAQPAPVERGVSVTVKVPGDDLGGGTPRPGMITMQGHTSPHAFLSIFQDGNLISTQVANDRGAFFLSLSAVPSGQRTIGIVSEDQLGRRTQRVEFSFLLLPGMVISFADIILPPTFSIEQEVVRHGQDVRIAGLAAPSSRISLFFRSSPEVIFETQSDNQGIWEFLLDTSELVPSRYEVSTRASSSAGHISEFSEIFFLDIFSDEILPEMCRGADLNFNGRVHLPDFSILLFDFEKTPPFANPCTDINRDIRVNTTDVSVMMYEWTE